MAFIWDSVSEAPMPLSEVTEANLNAEQNLTLLLRPQQQLFPFSFPC
jgi:hypothetical protein